ncbi:MAG: hypothetical protein FJW39_28700 [Acidobacteria bacterium]|nr:hypothetical protein [Acidobacteriota bacterium]
MSTGSALAAWKAAGPFGGAVEAVASLHQPGHALAGTPSALLFRTSNAGRDWTRVPFPAELNSTLHALFADPARPERWLAAVSPESPGGSGLWRTTDAGASWKPVEEFRGKNVWALAGFPADPAIAAAGASDGVYRSRDGGASWTRLPADRPEELRPVVSLAFDPRSPDRLFVGTTHLPWRTDDAGAHWESAHQGMLDDSDVFAIHVDQRDPLRVLASACSGMYSSTDGGRKWTRLRGSADASMRTYVILRSPEDPGVVLAGTSHGLIRSADRGATWKEVLPHRIKSLTFDGSSGMGLFAATSAGVFHSADSGVTFQEANTGLAARDVRVIALAGASVAVSNGGVTVLGEDGSWTKTGGPPFIALAALPEGGMAGITPSSAYQRVRGRWVPVPKPPGRLQSIAFRDAALWIGTTTGLYRRTTKAPAWTLASPRFKGQAVHFTDGVCANGRGVAMVRSAAGWALMSPPAPGAEWYQTAVSGGAVLAATSHGVFRSTDSGQSWTAAKGTPGGSTATAILAHPTLPGVAFAAAGESVYVSRDGGVNWNALSAAGLGPAFVRSLAIVPRHPERLYALAAARGIYITDWEKQP